MSSIGIDFDSWSQANGLMVGDGAVFYMVPDDGPVAGGDSVTVAQLTVSSGAGPYSAVMGMQGRSVDFPTSDD